MLIDNINMSAETYECSERERAIKIILLKNLVIILVEKINMQ